MTITYTLGDNLYINITNQCPNACEFCIRTHGSGVGDADNLWLEREPTREEIIEDLKKHNLSQYKEIVFCGYGEPTNRFDDLVFVLQELRKMTSSDLRINTNGLSDLINGRNTAKELDGLVDTISVSLNASTPEKYDLLCHSKFGLDALPAILKFTRNASLYIPKVYMTVVGNLPQKELLACRRLCEEAGAQFKVREYID
jgi:TatD family-associated radical SAM protein